MNARQKQSNASRPALQFGMGRRCINPNISISLSGYFNLRMWDQVLDDIEVRVLVLRSGDVWSALIQYDLVYASQDLIEALYAAVADAGIAELTPENMLITATHSHTAPEIRMNKPTADTRYLRFVVDQTLAAVNDARGGMRPGTPACGMTREHRFLFNRRYWMKNGEVLTNPGKLNPEIDRPEGEIDPEIPLLALMQDGAIRVLLANIVNHSDTIGGTGVSADWPGFLRRSLEKQLGAGSMVIPVIGASGNINHFDVRTEMNQTCYAEAARIGAGYAAAILKALPALQPLPDGAMFTRAARVRISPRAIAPLELAEAQAVLVRYQGTPAVAPDVPLTSADLVKKTPAVLVKFAEKIVEMAEFDEPINILLTGIFFNGAGIVSLPCEPFVEIGLTIRKSIFTGRQMMVAELSNGTGNMKIGGSYIPNAWNYGRGGYETMPRSNQFATDAADKLLAAWRGVARNIQDR